MASAARAERSRIEFVTPNDATVQWEWNLDFVVPVSVHLSVELVNELME
jgi:hypothetical protein